MAKKTAAPMEDFIEVNGQRYHIIYASTSDNRVNRKSMTIEVYAQKVKDGLICRDVLVQRTEGQWNNKKKSNLIVSIIKGYFIGIISYTVNRKNAAIYLNKSLIDGLQRTSTMCDFIDNKFALGKNTSPIKFVFENENGDRIEQTVELAGKKFRQLPSSIQQMILDYDLTLHEYVGFTDAELDEMVYNINEGTPLKPNQKLRPAYGGGVMNYVQPICNSPLWDNVKGCKAKNDSILGTVTRTMMLMSDYEEDYSAGNMNTYADKFEISDNEYMVKSIGKLVDRLNDIINSPKFSDEDMEFFNACNIPHIIAILDEWTGTDEQFVEYLIHFLHSDMKNDYDKYAASKSGSGAKQYSNENVNNRHSVIYNAMIDYIADNNIEGVELDEGTDTAYSTDDSRDSGNSNEYGTESESEEPEQLLLPSCEVDECGESEKYEGHRGYSNDNQSPEQSDE